MNSRREDLLEHADALRRDLDELVVGDPVERLLEAHLAWRGDDRSFVIAGGARRFAVHSLSAGRTSTPRGVSDRRVRQYGNGERSGKRTAAFASKHSTRQSAREDEGED